MPTPKKGPRLGGSPSHQKAILANLATSLFEHGRITTTEAKARFLRPYAERLITKAKRGDLHNRRQVLAVIRDKSVVHELFTEIGPRYADRPGGYTRITKIGPRKGDNAPMAVIELVEQDFTPKVRSTTSSTQAAAVPVAGAPVAGEPGSAPETEDATSIEAETDQVKAQDAVAAQAPRGETVEPAEVDAGAAEAETSEVESVDADADRTAADDAGEGDRAK